MKKYITLCLFTLALAFSSQNIMAQTSIEVGKAANEKTKELRKVIKIDDSKMEDIFQAYKTYNETYLKIEDNLEAHKEQLKKINGILDERLKEILNEEQFVKYLNLYRAS
ncbi:hypothetical protein [Sediminibacter sp. Hel_I_10]|uniref:hypothetical protein n=1 Tax=Sediminibacter sp. Hel_I_10 TaxID=1392490 RepID=UPI00047B9EDF|nr:hypothetical protein [Sediminibacter sp. Hel_I_10]